MLIDSHCHLDFPDFEGRVGDVVSSARLAGVEKLVTICTRLDRFENNRAIVEAHDNVWMGLGVHPLEAGDAGLTESTELLKLAAHPKVVGIGESGLDYHYQIETKAQQLVNFEVHVEAAQKTGMPLIVHTRDAEEDTFAILKAGMDHAPFKCIIHCFTGTVEFARQMLDLGATLSFSGIVTFKSATNIHEAARLVPADRYLVETDSPYLAPVPFRGKRNQPAYVAHTASHVAGLRGVPVEQVHAETGANFHALFDRVGQ